MNSLDHKSELRATDSRGIVAKAGGAAQAKQRHGDGPDLLISSDAMTDSVILGVLEDWIIPAVVERLLQSVTQLPVPPEEG